MYTSNGMGKTALSWQEVKAYSDLTQTELTPWESRQLIIMSRAYCNMNYEATENRITRQPYDPEVSESEIYNRGAHASEQADEALNKY